MTAHYKGNGCKKKSCTRPQSPHVRRRHMWVSYEKRRYDTELSKYLWELKMKNEEFTVSWKILAKARAY